jgi:hypothetical protein
VSDLVLFIPFLVIPLVLFSVLPAFFGRFFFILAAAAYFWIGSMNHGPDSPGLVYGLIAACVATAAMLAEGIHLARRTIRRRGAAHG